MRYGQWILVSPKLSPNTHWPQLSIFILNGAWEIHAPLMAQSESLPEPVMQYSQAAKLRMSPFSTPLLNEASLDARFVETPPPLLDTCLEASIQNVTSLLTW